jgi:hypothetical protein
MKCLADCQLLFDRNTKYFFFSGSNKNSLSRDLNFLDQVFPHISKLLFNAPISPMIVKGRYYSYLRRRHLGNY